MQGSRLQNIGPKITFHICSIDLIRQLKEQLPANFLLSVLLVELISFKFIYKLVSPEVGSIAKFLTCY